MSRRYADPIDVQRRDDAPAAFLWRGRLYSVRTVLAHWVEAGSWWRRAFEPVSDPGSPRNREAISWGGLEERELEMWRVEAGAGRDASLGAPLGVYDLCFDWSGGGWSVVRTHD